MRICIPTEEPGGADARIAAHFGSAPTFTIIDTESAQDDGTTVIENTLRDHGGSCGPARLIRKEKIDALVCSGIGRHAMETLAGTSIHLATAGTARELATALTEGRLPACGPDDACAGGHHGHGEHRDGRHHDHHHEHRAHR